METVFSRPGVLYSSGSPPRGPRRHGGMARDGDRRQSVRAGEPPDTADRGGELAQELRPDRFGLGRADFHAENLAAAVTVDANGDDDGDRDDAAAAAHLQVSGATISERMISPVSSSLNVFVRLTEVKQWRPLRADRG